MLKLHFFKHISVELDQVVVIPARHMGEAIQLLENYVGLPKDYMHLEYANIATAKHFVFVADANDGGADYTIMSEKKVK